jgi:hypothetical protein
VPDEVRPLPFEEAIQHFRGKLNLPTERWDEITKGMHARAFVVAGAQKAELLVDFRAEIDKALTRGTTIQDFRKAFDDIVRRHGWSHNGTPGWRSRVIYETNLRTAYQAGRYKQMSDPEVLQARPFWQYRHGDSITPRPEHLSWDGLVLPADDPWWETHYPPNGWGCKCKVFALSEAEMRRLGKTKPDAAPDQGTVPWRNPATGQTEQVPRGIDPSWNYNVGEAAWGKPLTWQKDSTDWTISAPDDWQSLERPKRLPTRAAIDLLLPPASTIEEAEQQFIAALGGKEESISVGREGGLQIPIRVDARALAQHFWDRDRSRMRYFPWMLQALRSPEEVWLAFFESERSGRFALRVHALAVLQGKEGKPKCMVFGASLDQAGQMQSWTAIPTNDIDSANKRRAGRLLYAR